MANLYKALCPDCGSVFTPSQSHHRAMYGGCCRTFSGDRSYEHHLSADGCLHVEVIDGWRLTDRNAWTDSEPMSDAGKEQIQAEKDRRHALETRLPGLRQATEGRTPPPRSSSTGTTPKPSSVRPQ